MSLLIVLKDKRPAIRMMAGYNFVTRPSGLGLVFNSGRINKDSDLGIVWKASAILEMIADASERP